MTLKTLKDQNKILRGVKLLLLTTEEDEVYIRNLCYARDLVYNWAVDKLWKNYNSYKNHMEDYRVISYSQLTTMFTEYRNSDDCDITIKSLHTGVARVAIKDAVRSFIRLRHLIPKGIKPRYHGKHNRRRLSFGLRSDKSYIMDGELHTENMGNLPRLCIPIATHRYDGYGGNGLSKNNFNKYWYGARIVEEPDGFYLTFSIPRNRNDSLKDHPTTEPIGIDLGCRTTFQLSTEEFFNQPDVSRLYRKISDCDREITRLYKLRKRRANKLNVHSWDIPHSKNEIKKIDARNKAYRKIHNIITQFYYEVINDIVRRNPEAIVLETIYVTKILQQTASPFMRKEIAQVYFCMIRYMFEAKCDEYSIPLYEVIETYPSSLICNNCKYIHKELGNKKTFVCPNCGYTVDRDLNASLNLRDVYVNKEVDNIKWWNGHGDKLILMDKITNR